MKQPVSETVKIIQIFIVGALIWSGIDVYIRNHEFGPFTRELSTKEWIQYEISLTQSHSLLRMKVEELRNQLEQETGKPISYFSDFESELSLDQVAIDFQSIANTDRYLGFMKNKSAEAISDINDMLHREMRRIYRILLFSRGKNFGDAQFLTYIKQFPEDLKKATEEVDEFLIAFIMQGRTIRSISQKT